MIESTVVNIGEYVYIALKIVKYNIKHIVEYNAIR